MRAWMRLGGALVWLVLACLWPAPTSAQESASVALSNGATVRWRLDKGDADPRLGLSVPAFARWTRSGFAEPLEITMRSDARAVVDAWQLAFYRIGDTRFERPVRRFRGDGPSLDAPLSWDGRVESGPALRPGETVVARLDIRDVAGNLDSTAPQEVLIARYAMTRERRSIEGTDENRARAFAKGEAPAAKAIPLRGTVVTLTVTGWPDDEAPRASGVSLGRSGKGWTLRQFLPPGRHDIVIQSARPIIGGMRMIPVGAISVLSPETQPFQAMVKGTGRLPKSPVTPEALSSDDFAPQAMVPGAMAISRMMTDRDDGKDRLALALLPADRPVTLAMDGRKRMALLAAYGEGALAWPGTVRRPPADPGQRRMSVAFAAPTGAMLVLPYTDVVADSLRLSLRDWGALVSGRDYAFEAGEGRILLSASVLEVLRTEEIFAIDAAYAVPVFAARNDAWSGGVVQDGGASFDRHWTGGVPGSSTGQARAEDDLFARALKWLSNLR